MNAQLWGTVELGLLRDLTSERIRQLVKAEPDRLPRVDFWNGRRPLWLPATVMAFWPDTAAAGAAMLRAVELASATSSFDEPLPLEIAK